MSDCYKLLSHTTKCLVLTVYSVLVQAIRVPPFF